jgi:hypothetical protein
VAFCEEELKDKYHMKLNPERKVIYQDTVRLGKLALKDKSWDWKDVQTFWKYVGEHIGWYWN